MNEDIGKKKRELDKKKNVLDERKHFIDKISIFILVIFSFGYVINIIKTLSVGFDSIDTMMVLRIIVFFVPPLGAILGYF